jgi:hypothetical protein
MEEGRAGPGLRFWVLCGCVVSVLTALCYHATLADGFGDFDTLPTIHEGRVESWSDLVGQLGKQLTGGRAGPSANFYRPTTMLLFSGLHGAFGWEPAGYHGFALALHALNGLLLGVLAATLGAAVGLAGAGRFGLLGAAIFVIHPLGLENVPSVTRIQELLPHAFVFAALILMIRVERRSAGGSGTLLPALLGYYLLYGVALGAKESGVVIVGGASLLVLGLRLDLTVFERVKRAARLAVPCVILTLLFLVARAQVLGDPLGGYQYSFSRLTTLLRALVGMGVELPLPGYAHTLLYRFSPALNATFFRERPELALGALLAVLLLLGMASFLLRRSGKTWRSILQERALPFFASPEGRIAAFCLLMLLQYAALMVIGNFYSRRNLYAPSAFWSLLAALAWVWAVRWVLHFRSGQVRLRPVLAPVGVLAVGCAAGLLLWQSPLIHDSDEWRDAGHATRTITEKIRDGWAQLPDGARVYLVNLPATVSTDPMRLPWFRDFSTTFVLADYSVQAWLDAKLPEKGIRVVTLTDYHYQEPIHGFRHRSVLLEGSVNLNLPRGFRRKTPDVAPGAERFRWEPVGGRRVALSHAGLEAQGADYLLIFDGTRPVFVAVAAVESLAEGGPARGDGT